MWSLLILCGHTRKFSGAVHYPLSYCFLLEPFSAVVTSWFLVITFRIDKCCRKRFSSSVCLKFQSPLLLLPQWLESQVHATGPLVQLFWVASSLSIICWFSSRQSLMYRRLTSNSLCSQGWPSNLDPPASVTITYIRTLLDSIRERKLFLSGQNNLCLAWVET